ncbi:MAG TPA: low specificity L-threonine aldolase, partial [Candidatus Eisenbacteria bacterium]|nr:low specificity L-threonine aldolase [Candidatus Eisenbacteria bacterium]
LHALEHGIARLAEDHDRARAFARAIGSAGLPGVAVEPPETNMVYVRLEDPGPRGHARLAERLRAAGVLSVAIMERAVRFVFHRDVPPDGAERAAAVVIEALRTRGAVSS